MIDFISFSVLGSVFWGSSLKVDAWSCLHFPLICVHLVNLLFKSLPCCLELKGPWCTRMLLLRYELSDLVPKLSNMFPRKGEQGWRRAFKEYFGWCISSDTLWDVTQNCLQLFWATYKLEGLLCEKLPKYWDAPKSLYSPVIIKNKLYRYTFSYWGCPSLVHWGVKYFTRCGYADNII